MSLDVWLAVDELVAGVVGKNDVALDAALAESEAAGLPAIHVSAAQGKFLHLLATIQQSRSILEIGTLGGYSTIWLARALKARGRLITLEADATHAQVAAGNIKRAGLGDVVELRLGKALDTLPQLAGESLEPFDLVFIDADKVNTTEYFGWAMRMTRPGSVIVVDNVVRKGAVIDGNSADVNVQAMRRFFTILEAESRVSATVIQTVGSKGYDGFVLASVLA